MVSAVLFIVLLCRATGNPLEEKHTQDGDWRDKVCAKLVKLKKLDGEHFIETLLLPLNFPSTGIPVVRQEDDEEDS